MAPLSLRVLMRSKCFRLRVSNASGFRDSGDRDSG